jgi:hypothetical protein
MYTRSQEFEVGSLQTAAGGEIHETVIFDLSSGQPELYGIAIGFNDGSPADNLMAPLRRCRFSDAPRLHCGQLDEPLPSPWL